MIIYDRKAFGINLLLRFHGSAVYRGAFMGILSVICFILMRKLWSEPEQRTADEISHPYAVGVLVATLTFLLVFRTQQAYARYWEAATSVYHMMSKWIDATTHTSSYHYQCDHYKHVKPPAFFDYPHLNQHFLTRDRERRTLVEQHPQPTERIGQRATTKSIEPVSRHTSLNIDQRIHKHHGHTNKRRRRKTARGHSSSGNLSQRGEPEPLEGMPRLDGGLGSLFDDGCATFYNKRSESSSADMTPPDSEESTPPPQINGFASIDGGHTPPLFLQELAHLCSLAIAVALSTLRNGIEGAESPLDVYVPGKPFPAADPRDVDDGLAFEDSFLDTVLLFLGMGRTPEQRTRYNVSRPLKVIGGVSDAEIRFLQMARGPYAKTQLAWSWLSEFIVREHLAGSLGKVGPPIISRIFQFLGDGMIYYNHARKIMFIPFPFPHSQLSAMYVLVAVPTVAFLMDQYTDGMAVGCILTFLTVTALSGVHEVARELENPFRNVPNEIPLSTLMAEANEALITMYSGYHPDLYWADAAKQYAPHESSFIEEPLNGEMPASAPSMEDKINELMEKIEEQNRQIEQLKASQNANKQEPATVVES